jgi:lactoylglutathione lyase
MVRDMTTNAAGWPTTIAAITLVTDDLPGTDRFYRDVFKMEPVHSDDDSVVFRFGETLINLLRSEAAPELVDPAPVVGADAGVRSVLTVHVEDVDKWCATLKERGVELLNGPMDRPWGPRTASFRDPSGQIWEIAS